MKKIIIGAFAMLTILLCFSFKTIYDLQNSTAKANEVNGLLIFSYSDPVKDFRTIGKIKKGLFDSNDYSSVVSFLSKDAKKQYPTADAIIVYYDGKFVADVIEFNK